MVGGGRPADLDLASARGIRDCSVGVSAFKVGPPTIGPPRHAGGHRRRLVELRTIAEGENEPDHFAAIIDAG
jgi:hypothetical protein